MDPEKIGLGVLCLALVGILSWVVKYLAKINGNHLRHIQESIDTLPCKDCTAACRVEGDSE